MAVAFLSAPASMTAEQYDRVIKQLDASGAGDPPGRRFHACFGPADHLKVFDVWDSAAQLQAFGTTVAGLRGTPRARYRPLRPVRSDAPARHSRVLVRCSLTSGSEATTSFGHSRDAPVDAKRAVGTSRDEVPNDDVRPPALLVSRRARDRDEDGSLREPLAQPVDCDVHRAVHLFSAVCHRLLTLCAVSSQVAPGWSSPRPSPIELCTAGGLADATQILPPLGAAPLITSSPRPAKTRSRSMRPLPAQRPRFGDRPGQADAGPKARVRAGAARQNRHRPRPRLLRLRESTPGVELTLHHIISREIAEYYGIPDALIDSEWNFARMCECNSGHRWVCEPQVPLMYRCLMMTTCSLAYSTAAWPSC